MWPLTFVLLAFGRLGQEAGLEFWSSLGYRVRSYLNKTNKQTKASPEVFGRLEKISIDLNHS